MILIDLNQVMISVLMKHLSDLGTPNSAIDVGIVRHKILNTIRSLRSKFIKKYGELVITCDGQNCWRRDTFPYYKASRKKSRDEGDLDWNDLFGALNTVRDELKEFFPYKVIQIDRAEADDVIASLCHRYGSFGLCLGKPILIVSGDKDFVQLQKYANVEQWSPTQKVFLREPNPARFLHEHIIRGDRGDGVPNFLSADDVFVTEGSRQTPITQKKLDSWNGKNPEEFCDERMLRNWKRNQLMVDLDLVPDDIQAAVKKEFDSQEEGDRSKLFNYFISRRLRNLMDSINDF